MSVFEKRRLHRYEYWQGQMLRSSDFQSQLADTAQHRWWHNRALHNAFGVYQGLTASPLVTSGDLSGVGIALGVAYDCFGRELIVDTPQNINLPVNVPPGSLKMLLLVRYESQTDASAQSIQEICWSNAGTQGTVSFVWLPEDQVRLHDGVALARVVYTNGRPSLDTTFVPPGARPIARPKIASGATVPAATAWEPWTIDTPHFLQTGVSRLLPTEVGVQVRVDTSAAGFTQTPCYFASLGGPLLNSTSGLLLPDMFTSLADESPSGFTFRMWFPPPVVVLEIAHPHDTFPIGGFQVINQPAQFFPFARTQKLYVQWLACQMPATVPYVPLSLRLQNELLLSVVLEDTALQKAKLAIDLMK